MDFRRQEKQLFDAVWNSGKKENSFSTLLGTPTRRKTAFRRYRIIPRRRT
jgi:hypothetical protein